MVSIKKGVKNAYRAPPSFARSLPSSEKPVQGVRYGLSEA